MPAVVVIIECGQEITASYMQHKSIAYGADWMHTASGGLASDVLASDVLASNVLAHDVLALEPLAALSEDYKDTDSGLKSVQGTASASCKQEAERVTSSRIGDANDKHCQQVLTDDVDERTDDGCQSVVGCDKSVHTTNDDTDSGLRRSVIATCSFYDHNLHLWQIEL